MWQINTFGNGDVLSDVFRSIVFMMGGGYESLLRLGMICLIFGSVSAYLGRGRVVWQWVIGALLILAVTMNIRMPILVHDLVHPWVGDQVIADVPLAVAFPAYMTSEISYQTMVGVETTFGLPAEYRLVNSTIGKGFFDMQKTLSLEMIPGDLQINVTNYLKDCTFPAIQLGELNRGTILDAVDMAAAIQTTNAAISTMEVRLGNPFASRTCPEMYDRWITNGLVQAEPGYAETMRQFRAALGIEDVADNELTPVQSFSTNIIGTAQGPRVLINNVLLRERWKDAEVLDAEEGNDTATTVGKMNRSISEDLKNQAFNDSMLSARFVPLLRTVAESAVYLLTPLMLALAMSPAMFATIRGAITGYGWLFMWIPMFVIMNFVSYRYGVEQMNLITVNQITFNSYDQYFNVLLGLNTFMGKLIWAVPTLATVVTYGMSSMASSLAGAASGAQQAANQEASAFAHGDGKYIEPGQHLKEETTWSQDAHGHMQASSHYADSSGLAVHRQDGSTAYSYSDGSSLLRGADGTEQYHGAEGSWARKGDQYTGGAWRQEFRDEQGEVHQAEFQVSGDHVDVAYTSTDEHGVNHENKEVWDQGANQRQMKTDTYSDQGVTHQITTMGDGSEHSKHVGTAQVPLTRNGQTDLVTADVTASFSRPSADSPWGEGVMTAHSTEHGDFQYSLSDVKTDDRGVPDFSQGMTVTSGHGTDLMMKTGSSHGLMTTTSEGRAGELTRSYTGTPAEGVEVFHSDGSHERMGGVVSGQGGVAADGSSLPFQGQLTVDQDGFRGDLKGELSYNDKDQRWELHASDETWQSRLQGESSGVSMHLPHSDMTLAGGRFAFHGNPHDPQTAWSYDGPATEKGQHTSKAHVEGKDGQIFFSDLASGGTQHVLDDDGHRLTLMGNLGGDQFTYEESWTGLAFKDDGYGHLTSIGQTHFTSRGHASVDPNKEGSVLDRLMKSPDTTVAENKSAFGERSLAVDVAERPLSELPIGQTSLSVIEADGQSSVNEPGVLHGGEGVGYVISAGAGTEKVNSIDRTQNVQTADGHFETQQLRQDSSGKTISGSKSSVVDSRTRNADGELVTKTLARGGDGTGEFEVMTQSRSNENSFSGTFQVPRSDGQGSTRVAGKIEMSHDGDIVSMNFSNAAIGKQVGYHQGEKGPIFTVADVEADPRDPSKGRLTNEREVSHREAESAGGFHIRDVLNQAGAVISSQGNKGIDREEFHQYGLHTKIDEQSTLVGKGQQSLEALGMAEPFNPDQPGVWKDAARTAEGVRLGWSTSMEALRAARFKQSADKILGGSGESPRYDPNAPSDPALKGTYDAAKQQVDEFMKRRGITPKSRRK